MTSLRKTAIGRNMRMFTVKDNSGTYHLFYASLPEFIQMKKEIDEIIQHMQKYPEEYE
jgi:muconolactone delta-isomerase